MLAVIITCFDYDFRTELLKPILEKNGFTVNVIISDFQHIKKAYISDPTYKFAIHVKAYNKNLSLERLKSHIHFSEDVYSELVKMKPDLIYALLPPNTLAKECAKYKQKYNCKLYFDIIDMWPESIPISNNLLSKLVKFPFNIWKNLRNDYLKYADGVITECNLYQEILLNQKVKLPNINTLYLCAKSIDDKINPILDNDILNICYLGSINNIIAIDKIVTLLDEINKRKKVKVHIIGDGESRQEFIDCLTKIGVEVVYYGKIFDIDKKLSIINKCHFGLNMMKDNVVVGLTMKSVDYMQAGLPFINNIKADTFSIVKKYNIGYNIENNYSEIANEIANLTEKEFLQLRQNTRLAFMENFEETVIQKKIISILNGEIC